MTLLDKARRDFARAEANAAAARVALAHAESAIHELKPVVSWLERNTAKAGSESTPKTTRSRKPTGVTAAAVECVYESKNGVTIEKIEEALRRKGIVVGGKNPRANLASLLTRNRHLAFSRGAGWVPATPEKQAPSDSEGALKSNGVGAGNSASTGEEGGSISLFAPPGASPADPGP